MGVIGRAFDLMNAKSKQWMGKKETENAGARANEAAEDIAKDSAQFTTGAAQAIAQLEGVKDQKKAADAEVTKWHNAAVDFHGKGNDTAAKQALQREQQAQSLSDKLQAQITQQQGRIDALKQKAQDLNNTVQDAKNSAQAIQAREKVISAEEKIKSADPNAALNKLKDAEADVTARERTQDAVNDMSGSNLEAEANKLSRDQKVDDAFAKLDAEVAAKKGGAAPAAPGSFVDEWHIAG